MTGKKTAKVSSYGHHPDPAWDAFIESLVEAQELAELLDNPTPYMLIEAMFMGFADPAKENFPDIWEAQLRVQEELGKAARKAQRGFHSGPISVSRSEQVIAIHKHMAGCLVGRRTKYVTSERSEVKKPKWHADDAECDERCHFCALDGGPKLQDGDEVIVWPAHYWQIAHDQCVAKSCNKELARTFVHALGEHLCALAGIPLNTDFRSTTAYEEKVCEAFSGLRKVIVEGDKQPSLSGEDLAHDYVKAGLAAMGVSKRTIRDGGVGSMAQASRGPEDVDTLRMALRKPGRFSAVVRKGA